MESKTPIPSSGPILKEEPEQHRVHGRTSGTEAPVIAPPQQHPVSGLQRVFGNRAVRRMLGPSVLQPKLTIGSPDDIYEKEADQVAEKVGAETALWSSPIGNAVDAGNTDLDRRLQQDRSMAARRALRNIPIRRLQQTLGNQALSRLLRDAFPAPVTPESQRKCACSGGSEEECPECRIKRLSVQRLTSSADAGLEAPPILEDVLGTPGQPLAESARRILEPRFGQDFSHVRVHDDSKAAESAASVNAHAYTVGNHIVFGSGKYAPGTADGNHLLAHELTHTIQQGAASTTAAQRWAGNQAGTSLLQRQSEDGPGQEHLQSPRFASSAKLERCFENKDRLGENDPDTDAVTRIQQALLDLSTVTRQIYDLGPTGADGRYGPKTAAAIRKFKTDQNLGSTQFGDVGPGTMHRLDQLFAGSPPPPSPGPLPTPTQCQDSSATSNEKDPLPAVPAFQPQFLGATELLEKVKKMQPLGHPVPKNPPLGATQPTFTANPVKVSTVPEAGSSCLKCVADWDLTAAIAVFIAVGSFSDEPKRFAAFQKDSVSGCPFKPLPELLEVRKAILPEAVALSITAEREHYDDFVRAFRMAGGRYLANVRRLTAERTPLRGKDLDECTDKVEDFLSQALGVPGFNKFLRAFLHTTLCENYPNEFVADFLTLFNAPDRDRDGGPHLAKPFPPSDQAPLFPNIDTDINPFGCKAFARKFNRFSGPGIPGPSSEDAIKDINEPPKQVWHAL